MSTDRAGGSDCGARPDCRDGCVWVAQGLKPCGLSPWQGSTPPPPRARGSVVVIAGRDPVLTDIDLARIEWHANNGDAV